MHQSAEGGVPPPSTPESTEEEDSSASGVDFSESDDFKVETGASPPTAQRGAGVEASTMTLGERRLAPATLVVTPAARAERRSPIPAAGQRSPAPVTRQRLPAPAAGRRTPASTALMGGGASAVSVGTPGRMAPRVQAGPRVTPSDQSSGGASVPRARRSGTGKCSMSARSE